MFLGTHQLIGPFRMLKISYDRFQIDSSFHWTANQSILQFENIPYR